ncbi:MAG: hypothetical protein KJ939_01400 [Nanoarchaeota archaeon]|nr:hypothetical protein [Nanoarchaeota archaeon]MBU4351718.1 hypothetical protein [Nanoarchaeota archaeon]
MALRFPVYDKNHMAYMSDYQQQKININDFVAYNLGELVAKSETEEGLLKILVSKDIESNDCLILKVMPCVKDTSKTERAIKDVGPTQPRINPEFVKKKLID